MWMGLVPWLTQLLTARSVSGPQELALCRNASLKVTFLQGRQDTEAPFLAQGMQ